MLVASQKSEAAPVVPLAASWTQTTLQDVLLQVNTAAERMADLRENIADTLRVVELQSKMKEARELRLLDAARAFADSEKDLRASEGKLEWLRRQLIPAEEHLISMQNMAASLPPPKAEDDSETLEDTPHTPPVNAASDLQWTPDLGASLDADSQLDSLLARAQSSWLHQKHDVVKRLTDMMASGSPGKFRRVVKEERGDSKVEPTCSQSPFIDVVDAEDDTLSYNDKVAG